MYVKVVRDDLQYESENAEISLFKKMLQPGVHSGSINCLSANYAKKLLLDKFSVPALNQTHHLSINWEMLTTHC